MVSLAHYHLPQQNCASHHLNSNIESNTTLHTEQNSLQKKIQKIKDVLIKYNGTLEVLKQIEEIEKIDSLRERFLYMRNLLNAPLAHSQVGYSLLHFASRHFYLKPGEQKPLRTQEMIQDLLEAGADVKAKSNIKGGQVTPLHIAGANRNLFAIDLLLNKGADPEAKDRFGCSPLASVLSSLTT